MKPCTHNPAIPTTCRVCWLAANDPRYQRLWGITATQEPSTPYTPPPPVDPPHGPGTELKDLLHELGLSPGNCECNSRARQMNQWGIAICRERRAEIIAWLEEQKAKQRWGKLLASALRAAVAGWGWLNPVDVLGSLVDEAIRRAEEKGHNQ